MSSLGKAPKQNLFPEDSNAEEFLGVLVLEAF